MTKSQDSRTGGSLNKAFSRRFQSKLAGDAAALSVAHVVGLLVPFLDQIRTGSETARHATP